MRGCSLWDEKLRRLDPEGGTETPEAPNSTRRSRIPFTRNSAKKYSMVFKLTRNMDTVLEKLEVLTEKPKPKTYSTNIEASYTTKKMHILKN